MTLDEFNKLTKEKQYYIRREFLENKNNSCCSMCDSMIEGYCYNCKAWCSNIKPDEKKCFRIKNTWKEFLGKINKGELDMFGRNSYGYTIKDYNGYGKVYFDKYFSNDYLVESLLDGKLEDALDEYDKYCNRYNIS